MNTTSALSFVSVVLYSILMVSSAHGSNVDVVQCLTLHTSKSSSKPNIVYTKASPQYFPILNFSIPDLRFASPSLPKPNVIVTPLEESDIQATIYCTKKYGFEIRVRCGGHDFEGQSFISDVPFILVDLFNLREITVDAAGATAWAQAGATQGELYYAIATTSNTLAFPGGEFPSVGIGGFISGGGYGMLQRKYGLGADNVLDAHFIDPNGRILDRESMGEDLFWAIRGGGGGNFGVVVAWKIKLVSVPSKITYFDASRYLNESTEKLVLRWQSIAPKFPKDLFVRLGTISVNSTQEGKPAIQFMFQALFLGEADKLLEIINESLPELGLTREECIEGHWIDAILHFDGSKSLDDLLNREYTSKSYYKITSDFVQKPLSLKGLKGLWDLVLQQEPMTANLAFSPLGGRMSEISESSIPFPHRKGNLFIVFYGIFWFKAGNKAARGPLDWIRDVYRYMTPYVSSNPRGAYVNYRDFDFGITTKHTTYDEAKVWGNKYFKNNLFRLARVKTEVDPHNFFRNGQSIPPLHQLGSQKYGPQPDKIN